MKGVEAGDLSTKEFAVEGDESSMDESKLEGGALGERRISTGCRMRWTVKYWLRGRFLELFTARTCPVRRVEDLSL
jgi:hypothetical protein